MHKLVTCLSAVFIAAGCSTPKAGPYKEIPKFFGISDIAVTYEAPLALRAASPYPAVRESWSLAGMKLEGGTKTATEITEVLAEVAIASPYFPPALVFAPLAIIAGMATTPAVEAAREQYLKPCRDIWSADGGDVAGRLKAIFWKDSIPALLDKKLRKHFAAKGLEARLLPIIIDKHLQFSEKPKAPWSHDAFEEVHQGLGKSVIIGGELEMTLTWGKPEDQCGVKLEFNLPLNAITFEPEYRYLAESEVTVTRSLLGEEAIKRLANDPEIAAALIHGAVEELADGIAWRYFP